MDYQLITMWKVIWKGTEGARRNFDDALHLEMFNNWIVTIITECDWNEKTSGEKCH